MPDKSEQQRLSQDINGFETAFLIRGVKLKSLGKTVIAVAVTAAVTFSATSVYYATKQIRLTESSSNTEALRLKLDTVNTYIENNYLYDDIDFDKANDAAVRAYVESLEEPYTHYYPEGEFESYLGKVEESYVGIGVIISPDTENNKIVIVSPLKDSPAYKAGLKPGDFILEVDGVAFDSSSMDACVSAIKSGKEGTEVEVVAERNGKKKNYTIVRSEIIANSVTYEMLDDKIGYIAISNFNTHSETSSESTYTEFVDAVDELNAQGMKKLIIDVRDNPGGVLGVVCNIADYILPEGIITYTETRKGIRQEYKSDKNEFQIPMAVLINSSSASASEILAGALKDYDRAEIIGETSFGKGIVQNVFPFSDGSGMSMTVSKYYTPNGTSIHGVGVKPDIEVEIPEEYKDAYASDIPRDKDTQLNKAIEILKEK